MEADDLLRRPLKRVAKRKVLFSFSLMSCKILFILLPGTTNSNEKEHTVEPEKCPSKTGISQTLYYTLSASQKCLLFCANNSLFLVCFCFFYFVSEKCKQYRPEICDSLSAHRIFRCLRIPASSSKIQHLEAHTHSAKPN